MGVATARVVMSGGELRGRVARGGFFCDADGIVFEGHVVAVLGNVELHPGQIYFVSLAEEVAAVAVKTSAALVNPTGGHCRRGAVAPLVFPLPDEGEMVVAAEAAPSRWWCGSSGWRAEAGGRASSLPT
uniref:Uncharacterized protein n=1 Tax=Oryza nivara TaxID=4536 RepID=A0A0E0GQ82_ORYNI